MLADKPKELRGVACLTDDAVAGLGEQAGDPFAQQEIVVGDHHRTGSSRQLPLHHGSMRNRGRSMSDLDPQLGRTGISTAKPRAGRIVPRQLRTLGGEAGSSPTGVLADATPRGLRRSSHDTRQTRAAPKPLGIAHTRKGDEMKIVVIGGTGLIGSNLVEKLREAGQEPLPASPDTGVNTVTGEGLAEALAGAQVVVDVANAPDWDDAAVMDFFRTASTNLVIAEAAAGVKHHVALSVVGADRLPESGYMRAKLAQEDIVKAGSVPYTILRATQFFEFVGRIADSSADGETIRLAPVFVQPESANDVAATLCDIAVNEPVNGIVELGGPEQFRLDELARRILYANNDARQVTADVHARYYGAELEDHSLTPGSDARIAPTRFEDWIGEFVAR